MFYNIRFKPAIVLILLAVLSLSVSTNVFAYPSKEALKLQAMDKKASPKIVESYGKLPLRFEKNEGQTDSKVKFFSRGNGYSLFLTPTESVLMLTKPVGAKEATTEGNKAIQESENFSKQQSLKQFRHTAWNNSDVEDSQSDVTLSEAEGKRDNLSQELEKEPTSYEAVAISMKIVDANPNAKVSGREILPGKANYFFGKDRSKWRTNVSNFKKVRYEEVYPGIDLVYYGNQRKLEYDFVVQPGADPKNIALQFEGMDEMSIDDQGNLVLQTANGDVIQQAPIVYQEVGGERQPIDGKYRIQADDRVAFVVGDYNTEKPLVIDPILQYSTYFGGNSADDVNEIAVDDQGNVYISGRTNSDDLPITTGAFNFNAGKGVFVTKINPSGTAIIYSAALGVGYQSSLSGGIAVDASGNVYVTGETIDLSFPTTSGAYQETHAGIKDVFVTKLNPSGSDLVYSTLLGGSDDDAGRSITIDGSGNAYITGEASVGNFPTTSGVFQENHAGNKDVFIAKLNASGTSLIFSTFLGGSGTDIGKAIDLDSSGNIYVAGPTQFASDFPTTAGSFEPNSPAFFSGFITKLNPSATALVYSTYIGDLTNLAGMDIDDSGNAYVIGHTTASNFPVTPGAYQTTKQGSFNVFVTKLNAAGSALDYSTYLGENSIGRGISVDSSGNAYITGRTSSSNFPVTPNAFQSTHSGVDDAFIAKLSSDGTSLDYSTFIGGTFGEEGKGIVVDDVGYVYVVGQTSSPVFPTTGSALYPNYLDNFSNGLDGFLVKMDFFTPTLEIPGDITTEATGPLTSVDLGTATGADTSGNPLTPTATSATGTITPGDPITGDFPPGVHSVNWSVEDAQGNTKEEAQTITITDTTPPDVTPPPDITVETPLPTIAVSLGNATASDLVDGSLTPSADDTGPFAVGVHTITWSATDNAGNTGTATQIVTVNQANAPVVTAPADITIEATGPTTPVSIGTATATDVEDGVISPTADKASPFAVGIHIITWSAVDTDGHVGSDTQTVTVTDTTKPVLTFPSTINLEATGPTTPVNFGITATDLVDGAITPTADNPGPFSLGTHTVTWTATDSNGNSETGVQTITIVDTTPPVVTAPPDTTTEAIGSNTSIPFTGDGTAIDLVDGALFVLKTGPGSVQPPGVYINTYTATDLSGNTASDTQTNIITDTTPPVVTPPPDVTVQATGETTPVDLGTATALDLVDHLSTPVPTPNPAGPFTVGVHTVTWSSTDANGNTGTATQTVTVELGPTPVVTAPPDITVEATGATTPVNLGTATAVDDADGALTPTADNTGPFAVGVHTITWSATDSANNTGTSTQIVTVTDTTAPVVTAPDPLVVEATGATTPVTLGTATASDLVDGSLTPSANNTGPFAVGVHTVTWSVTDVAGNTGTATQTVTITDSTAPTVTAPVALTVEATGATTPVTLGTATASDLVDGALTPTANPTGPFAVGVHTVTWSVTDTAGNTGTATQTVTITDTTKPVVTAPAALTVEATAPNTPVSLGTATATDIVDGALTPTANPTGPFAVGEHTITWSATDAAGNIGTATQTVTITDTTAPTVTAPVALTVEATGATTPVTLGTATANDLADGALTPTADNTGPFAVGEHTITWSATDAAGNTGTATQTVTITDTTAPTVTPPTDITVASTGPTTPATLGTATASDLVDGTLTPTADNTGPFAVGEHTITWSATDAAGNTGTATQIVTVTDGVPPVVTAPADLTVEATGATTPVALGTATAIDDIDGALTPTADDTGPFAVGEHTITWSATDAADNTGTATQTVTVTDTTDPIVTAPNDLTVEATGATTPVTLGTATATDVVDGALIPTADNTGPFAVGEHTITWSITDTAGNTGTATQTVTITDTTAPTVTPPADVTVSSIGPTTPVALGNATASDLVDGALTSTADKASPFVVGVHIITWSATDAAGNTGTATQTVTVTDGIPPVVTAPAALTVEATGATTPVTLGTATATDDIDGALTPTPDVSGPFAVGVHTVTWSATDATGNTGTATQTVTITDTAAPVVTAPAALTLEATAANTPVALGTATATDIVDGALTPTADNPGPFAVGVHTVTWTATDAAGNSGTATQTVTITDTTAPTVTPPANLSVIATGPTTAVTLGTATAVDIVDGALTPSPDNAGPFAIGVHTVTWSATDTAGNSGTATQTVTITDGTPPVVTAPAALTVEATGATTPVTLGTATANDQEDGALTPTPDNSGPFTVGVHTVTWSATDSASNTGTATQIVTITDTTAPTVTAPAALTVTATGPTTAVTLGVATANDLVDGALTPTPDVTGPFAPGVHTVTWSATDSAGNTGTATQTVTVNDTTAPVVTAPAALTVEATAALTAVTLGTATANDQEDGSLTPTADNPGPFAVGAHTITWSATDAAGNTGTATQTVTITDTTAPVVTAPAALTVEATGATTPVTLGSATAVDIVDGALTPTPDVTGPFAVGVHTVTYTVSDAAGNSGTATQTVTITDTTAPTVTAPADLTVEATGATTPVTLGSATATDLVDGALTPTADVSGPFAVGVHTVTWSITDAAGNTGTATQTVTITDTTAPTVTAPAALTVTATGPTTAVTLGTATATDIVDGSLTPTADNPGPFAPGVHTVTWSATDAAGNTGTATQTVTVEDTTAPVVTAPAALTVEATGATTPVTLGTATANDQEDGALTPTADNTGPFAVGEHTITWSATDAAGNTGTATQTVTITDTTAPVVTAPAALTVEATAALTAVTLGTASATWPAPQKLIQVLC